MIFASGCSVWLPFVLDSILTFLGVCWCRNLQFTGEGLFFQPFLDFKKGVDLRLSNLDVPLTYKYNSTAFKKKSSWPRETGERIEWFRNQNENYPRGGVIVVVHRMR
jgi:hypothetical protein